MYSVCPSQQQWYLFLPSKHKYPAYLSFQIMKNAVLHLDYYNCVELIYLFMCWITELYKIEMLWIVFSLFWGLTFLNTCTTKYSTMKFSPAGSYDLQQHAFIFKYIKTSPIKDNNIWDATYWRETEQEQVFSLRWPCFQIHKASPPDPSICPCSSGYLWSI